MALHRLHASQRSACNGGTYVVLPDLPLLLYRGLQKDFQHGLFIATAVAEIVGCYLPWLWLRQGHSIWLLVPAAASLALFAWLLTLHPQASGRVYAAYGGVYISAALVWLWLVDGVRPSMADGIGIALCLSGMLVIMFGQRPA